MLQYALWLHLFTLFLGKLKIIECGYSIRSKQMNLIKLEQSEITGGSYTSVFGDELQQNVFAVSRPSPSMKTLLDLEKESCDCKWCITPTNVKLFFDDLFSKSDSILNNSTSSLSSDDNSSKKTSLLV